jgi:ankyrin repeat protein
VQRSQTLIDASPPSTSDSADSVTSSSNSGPASSSSNSSSSSSELLPPALAAARDGCLEVLQELSRGPGGRAAVASSVDTHGCGPLTWAAGSGHLACVQWLVRSLGCDPARPAKRNGRLPLHWASRNGHLRTVQWLVEGDAAGDLGAAEGAFGAEGARAASRVATRSLSAPPVVQRYLGLAPETPTGDGDTAFMLAAWQGHLNVCRWLVAKSGTLVAHAINRWGCNAAFKV